jgi:hypothetical protein
MIRYFLMIFTLLIITACTSTPLCEVAKVGAAVGSDQYAKLFNCKRVDLIKADAEKLLVDKGVCKQSASGLIGEIVCPSLVEGLLVQGTNAVTKPEYECDGGPAKEIAREKFLEVCKKAF